MTPPDASSAWGFAERAPAPARLHALVVALVLLTTTTVSASAGRGRKPASDRFHEAVSALLGDRSEKVRVQAALVLGRTREQRAVSPLIQALGDGSPVVRATVAQALGDIGDPAARSALEKASVDRHPMVRKHVSAALRSLTPRRPAAGVSVQSMGDKTQRARPELRDKMRMFVARELDGFGGSDDGGYTVDGAIKTLAVTSRRDIVEVSCSVELVLSIRATNKILMMSSGDATVQRPRGLVRAGAQPAIEAEALEHAVRGAADELRQHFAANQRR